MNRFTALLIAGCWLLLGCGAASAVPLERWVYCPTNLQVEENVAKLEQLFRRAARCGYTHVLLTDSKFARLGDVPAHYFTSAERLRKVAAELKLELVPAVFPIGWSNDLLYHDPNLAAGLPVRDARFEARGGEARLIPDPAVALPGGDMSDLARWSWHDDTVVADAGSARLSDLRGRNARIVQKLTLAPFRQYHVTVRVKTQDFRGTFEIKALAGDRALNYNDLGVRRSQDWTEHHTVFNSLENRELSLYLGCWGGGAGTLWLDDARIEEVGLLNVLRRPGAPLVVKREESPQPLVEGTDFEPVRDPRLGNVPYNGEFEVWHAPPTIRTRLPDGTRLRVSYYHPLTIYGGAVMIELAEPKTLELLADQARRVHKLWRARGYFMSHDEMRLFNWDAASDRRGLTAGKLLAENVRACTRLLGEVNPGGKIYVWSDMFDPHHNAVDRYYLVRGSLAGSWEGLAPEVIVANWNFDRRDASLRWFAERGHKTLIAGYYDAPVEQIGQWLDSAAGKPLVGVMYTTWQNNYADLERFARALDARSN